MCVATSAMQLGEFSSTMPAAPCFPAFPSHEILLEFTILWLSLVHNPQKKTASIILDFITNQQGTFMAHID